MNDNISDTDMDNNKVLLSICMVTYNHSKWIAEAIEGVLLQRTEFSCELIIIDDCSTDDTQKVIRKYWHDYPSLIKPHFNKNNLGLASNFSQALNKCCGKYIAICEGDDFWTDPLKLHKQIDYMESNRDCVLTSHNHVKLFEPDKLLSGDLKYKQSFSFDQRRAIKEWLTQPVTCVFRNIFKDYTYFNRENLFCDVILFYELLKHGYGYFMHNLVSTFRVHKRALSSGLPARQWHINHVFMFDSLFKYNPHDKYLQKVSRSYCMSVYIIDLKSEGKPSSNFKPIREYLKRSPNFPELMGMIFIYIPYYFVKYKAISKVEVSLSHE